MGDSLKLSKDKRHRSSSSIAGSGLDGTRSERKLDIRALIPEVEDHFAIAESRCDDLQEKINLVKLLKRKKKLNKRSMTRVNEVPTVSENVPFISVRTLPKKKVSQQGARTRRLEVPPNPALGYVDQATVEQHRMLGQVWGYGQNYNHQNEYQLKSRQYPKSRLRRNRADGDGMGGLGLGNATRPTEVACGQDDTSAYSDIEIYDQAQAEILPVGGDKNMFTMKRRKNLNRKIESVNDKSMIETTNLQRNRPFWKNLGPASARYRQKKLSLQQNEQDDVVLNPTTEERPVVELFNKGLSRKLSPPGVRSARITKKEVAHDGDRNDLNTVASEVTTHTMKKLRVRRKMGNRNYELPTVASQLKQSGARYHYAVANCSNIPFVVSKSTAPSHNIGANIQQVLNGMKMQQPVNGIPTTIAHHMGLGHVPFKTGKTPVKPSLNKEFINVITVGRRMLTLPSYRSISYNRMLTMYREGDGMVPRFLRSISRPNYIYTSMYDLAHREDTASTSKGRSGEGAGQESVDEDTKRRLAEYASIYAEYEKFDTLRKQGGGAEAEQRCDELLRELLAREEIIKQLMDNVVVGGISNPLNELRVSASTISEARRAKRDHPDSPRTHSTTQAWARTTTS